MEHIEFLKQVANELGQQNIEKSLNAIQQRVSQPNANILIPLVGEFSSGKTTLLNALTDSKKLETATKPTTATINGTAYTLIPKHISNLNNSI